MQRTPRKTDPQYLDWIRSLPCLLCGDNTTVEAAHVRLGERLLDKRPVGKGEKPDDRWALPLCGRHHRQQHAIGESVFWKGHDVQPLVACLVLQHSYNRDERDSAERFIASLVNSATEA